MNKTAIEQKTEELRAAAMKRLPKRLTCPKCRKSRTKDHFGLRITARDASGLPTRIVRQSYCSSCRAR
jgi:hypothetical protein